MSTIRRSKSWLGLALFVVVSGVPSGVAAAPPRDEPQLAGSAARAPATDEMAALPFRGVLPAIASKVRARCEKKYPQERAPFVLFGVDGPELSQTLEVHVAGNASAGLKRCIEEASRQELAQLGQRSGRHQSLHVVEIVGAEVPLPDAKRVLAAWRGLLVNGSKAARGLEALLPAEVHRRSDRSFCRDVESPEARVKLFDWLGAVAEWRHDDQFGINDLALWKDVLLHRCDIQIMSEDGLIGVASDGVCATRLEPELVPLVRLGLLPGLQLKPDAIRWRPHRPRPARDRLARRAPTSPKASASNRPKPQGRGHFISAPFRGERTRGARPVIAPAASGNQIASGRKAELAARASRCVWSSSSCPRCSLLSFSLRPASGRAIR